jgi:hypothetical protein
MLTIKCIDMAEYSIKWEEGDGYIIASYKERGDEALSFITDGPNEGLDREQVVTIETIEEQPTEHISVLVKQKGKRIRFRLADGKLLKTADDKFFNVLKPDFEK